jgi:hypothetical protein
MGGEEGVVYKKIVFGPASVYFLGNWKFAKLFLEGRVG